MRDALLGGELRIAIVSVLTSHICAVDLAGSIIAAHRSCIEFCAINAGDTGDAYIGVNYISICSDSAGPASAEADDFHTGIKAIL